MTLLLLRGRFQPILVHHTERKSRFEQPFTLLDHVGEVKKVILISQIKSEGEGRIQF